MDLYDGTLEALSLLLARIRRYSSVSRLPCIDGIRRAMEEFFREQTTPLTALSGQQALAVKI